MKELSIEEKAKRYDDVIRKAKIALDCCTSNSTITEHVVYDIFPELKESEDEKIRKWIIDDIRYNMNNEPLNNSEYKKEAEKAITWFEKQGEQNMIPLDKMIKFLDDQLVNDKDEVTGEPFINFKNYSAFKESFISYFKRKMLEKQSEQSPSQTDERVWLHLVSDVLTWKDGIGQYLNDPRVQELAKKLCNEYAHKLYNSVHDTSNEQKSNPYTGTSFEYNNHTWGMCARDGGIDILCDSKLIKHIGEQKPDERKEFVLTSFGTDIKLENDTIIIPEGCVATIDGNKIHIKREYKTATETIKEEKVDNANKVEPKFKVGDWVVKKDGKNFCNDSKFVQITNIDGTMCYFDCGSWLCEDKIRLWTISDARGGDIIYATNKYNAFNFIYIFSEIENENSWAYCSIDNDCDDLYSDSIHWCFDNCKGYIELDRYNFYPATKEQRDILFTKMKESGYEWNSEKKELQKIEQK